MASLTPKATPLSREQAAHLLRRTTFGPTRAEIDLFTGMTVDAALAELLTLPPVPPEPVDPNTGATWVWGYDSSVNSSQGTLRNALRALWLDRMIHSGPRLMEKMILFLHSHFTSLWGMVGRSEFFYQQMALFRFYAFGNIKNLAKKLVRDNCMLRFLDGYSNTGSNPNENFARELLELYTIGKGEQIAEGNYTTYTEDDVREAAKVLTGYKLDYTLSNIDPDTGLPMSNVNTNHHNTGDKVFSAAFQNTTILGETGEAGMTSELNQLFDMIFAQDATAEFLCRKLYRFFVYYKITPEVETDIILPLANTLRTNNYELQPVIEQLLKSQHFYDEDDTTTSNNTIGAVIKSPIEMLVSVVRYFDIPYLDSSTDLEGFYDALHRLHNYSINQEMTLLEPPLVAGWPAYFQEPFYNRNWINSSTYAQRNNAMRKLVSGFSYNGGANTFELDIVDFMENGGVISNPGDPNVVVAELVDDLFPFGVGPTKQETLKQFLLNGLDDFYWTSEWISYTAGVSDDSVVRPRLENLVRAIFQSVEFSLA